MALCSVEEAVSEIKKGKMIILVDDEDRENEGDLTMAAEFATPEAINFMAHHGCGLVCLAMAPSLCDKLGLDLMVKHNNSQFGTNFTVFIVGSSIAGIADVLAYHVVLYLPSDFSSG